MLITASKKRFSEIAEMIHFRLFGHSIGDEMREFLHNLSWSFFGGIVAAAIMFATNVLAGRWLGPVEHGKYNLIVAISSFLVAFMILGLEVSIPRL
jgi:O-antigen/teichoic acid export membrane protein